MKKEDLEALTKAYDKVANSLLELIRLKIITENSPELNTVSHTYSRFRDKADILKMLTTKDDTTKVQA